VARERYPWFKVHSSDLDGDALGALSDHAFRVWIVAQGLCNTAPYEERRRGEIRLESGQPVTAWHFSRRIYKSTEVTIGRALAELVASGLLGFEDGLYSIPTWRARQDPPSNRDIPDESPGNNRDSYQGVAELYPPDNHPKMKDVKRPDARSTAVPPESDLSLRPLAVPEDAKPPAREALDNGPATAGGSHKARPGGKRPTAGRKGSSRRTGVELLEEAIESAVRLGDTALAERLRGDLQRKREGLA